MADEKKADTVTIVAGAGRKTLADILGAKAGVEFEFTNMEKDETQGGDPILRFTPKEAINRVTGRRITDNVSGESGRIEAFDVELVSISKDALDEINKLEKDGTEVFTWTEEGVSGKIKLPAPFKLDVSRAQEVWISYGGFAKFAQNRRSERNSKQTSSLLSKVRDKQTQKEFKNTDVNAEAGIVPTPVSN